VVTRHQAVPTEAPRKLGDILSDWLQGFSSMGLCRACWCRQDLTEGARCLRCGGVIARVRVQS
jgi:hypothetical protein